MTSFRHKPRGNRTSSPCTSAPASRQSCNASASPRNSIPISSRMVSALFSINDKPSSSIMHSGAMLRVMNGSFACPDAARCARFAARPPPRRLRLARGCSEFESEGVLGSMILPRLTVRLMGSWCAALRHPGLE